MKKATLVSFFTTNKSFLLFIVLTFSFLGITVSLIPAFLPATSYSIDGGDLLAAILTAGIPHPTGYPTYILLGFLFQKIPISTAYFRGSLLSAIPASLAIGLVGTWPALGNKLGIKSSLWGSVVTGLSWGTTPLLLSQAVIVEVYGLHALFVVLTLSWILLLISYEHLQSKSWMLASLAGIYGLGVGNHVTLLLLAPVIMLSIWVARRNGLPRKSLFFQVVVMTLGLFVYIYLPIQARLYPPINWGNPQSLKYFLWLVSAQPYQSHLSDIQFSLVMERSLVWFNLLRKQFGLLGFLTGVAGIVRLHSLQKRAGFLVLWMFVTYSLFAILYQTSDSVAYLIPVYLAFSIWIGFGIETLWGYRLKFLTIAPVVGMSFLIYMGWRLPAIYNEINPKLNHQLDKYAQQFLEKAPLNSILYTETDADSFPLWYYHFGLKRRDDISIIVLPLTQYVWYQETLIHNYPYLKMPEVATKDQSDSSWGEAIASLNPDLPVCRSHMLSPEPIELVYSCSDHQEH